MKEKTENNLNAINEVRIGFYFDEMKIQDIDPAFIKYFESAQILNNIYSRLIEYDNSGSLQAGIASKFYFEGDFLVLEFNNKNKTLSGHFIDAEDAAVSIRRLLKLKTGTHSSIELILDVKDTNGDIWQNWEEIYTRDQKLFIQAKNLIHRPYLISSLATGDMAIIPKSAIDPKTLKITSHKETSGPYYIDHISSSDELETWDLKVNPEHYNILELTPKIVKLIDKKKPTAFQLLIDNEIDIIPTNINVYRNHVDELTEKVSNLKINHTLNLKLTYAEYSPNALKKFTRNERNYIVQKIIDLYKKTSPKYLSERTSTFFQDQSFGQLTTSEIHHIEEKNKLVTPLKEGHKISFKYNTFFKNKLSKYIQDETPELELTNNNNSTRAEKNFDLEINDTDTAFEESLPLIHYNFSMGTFGNEFGDYKKWISDYIQIESKEARAKKIHDLHLKALESGVIFPLFKSPYTSIGRNGFSLPLSPIFASSHFWKITRER